jgi:hypothetical protein
MQMKITHLAAAALAAMLAQMSSTSAWAGEVRERQTAIVLDLGDDAGVLHMDFSPFDLADGETRTVTSDDGRSHLLAKRDGQVVLTTDQGKEIALPAPPVVAEDGMRWVDDGSNTYNIEVTMDKSIGGLMISSAEPLDEATRQRIRDALKSAGVDQSVTFSEQGEHNIFFHDDETSDGAGQIHIIRKKVVVQEQDGH